MKSPADLVTGWIKKADSDLINAGLCVNSGLALDTACFHAQQAAEKLIKAYLIAYGITFPLIHNLEKLLELCAQHDGSFASLKVLGQGLTPYAVSLRYDEEFWPDFETAAAALDAAQTIRTFIVDRLPTGMKPT